MKRQCSGETVLTTKVPGFHKFAACGNAATITGPDGRDWCRAHAKKAGLHVAPSQQLYKVRFVVTSVPKGSFQKVGEVGERSVAGKSEKAALAAFNKVEKTYSDGVGRKVVSVEPETA